MEANLAIFDEVKAEMTKYKKINAELVFDYEDEQGAADARKHIKNMRKIVNAIAKVHKGGKAQALAVGRLYDAEKNANTAEIMSWIAVHADPLKKIEERIEAEKQAKIDAEIAKQEAAEVARLKELEEREAEMARKEAEIKAKEEATEREAREKRIAEEAAENARIAAEQAAAADAQRIKDEALAKEVEAEKAIARAKAGAEAAIKAAEWKAAEEKRQDEIETARLKQIEDDRVSDENHRIRVYLEAKKAIMTVTSAITEPIATEIMAAIDQDKIPNVTINY